MESASTHSQALEGQLQLAVQRGFEATEDTLHTAGETLQQLVKLFSTDPGSTSQQVATALVLTDFCGVELTEDDLPEGPLFLHPSSNPGEDTLRANGNQFADLAAGILAARASKRDQVVGYTALRTLDVVPSEVAEMYALAAARDITGAQPTDMLTTVYARRVLALVCSEPQEAMNAVRAAQDAGHPFEVMRLVEACHEKLPAPQAMSMLALGFSAAEAVAPMCCTRMHALLLTRVNAALHAIHHALPDDGVLAHNADARAYYNEFQTLTAVCITNPLLRDLRFHALAQLAMQQVMMGDTELAEDSLMTLEAQVTPAEPLPADVLPLVQMVQDYLRKPIDDNADEEEPDDDDRNNGPDDADYWKHS